MSASHIPNLNTLRRGGPRISVRAKGGQASTADESGAAQSSFAKDEVVRKTDTDAATSRLSAVEAGYLDDPFARLLVPGQNLRRLPLMNRGTYARTTAIDRIVDTFLDVATSRRKQIISLGAGSDTRFFRLRRRRPDLDLSYHELDFPENTTAKIALMSAPAFVEAAKTLCNVRLDKTATTVTEDGAGLQAGTYHIHPIDLRKLPGSQRPVCGICSECPTLIISECCLIYLSPHEADAALTYFRRLFPPSVPLAVAIYEPIRPNDAFGRTMVSNLTARGIHLQTFEKYASLKAQRDRLRKCGFSSGAEAADVDFIWRNWLSETERARVEGLEWMDEVEEFTLFARHYCVAWGWHGFPQPDGWQALPTQADDG